MDTTAFLQKPSLIQSLDVSHIISKHFGSLFSSDSVDPEMIENLTVSQGSTDERHRNYVSQLIKVTSEREKLFEQTNRLREHIFSARDRALQDDIKADSENTDFAYLKLPPAESTFYKYIDNDMLRENGLIAPVDVILTLNSQENGEKMESCDGIKCADEKVHRQNSANGVKPGNTSKTAEFRLPPIEKPLSLDKNKKSKENNKHKAPDMVLASEKDEDKYMLDMMASKNNYLKNPRYHLPANRSQSKEWLIKVNSKEESPKIFIPIPEIVEFSNYETGKVYEKLINFRNITTVLRHIRVLPPKSRFFSLGLGQFPGEKGLVAAGMSCQYAIRFSPDSLGDFEDEISVETQGGNSFAVKLIGRRPRPMLSGGTLWDIGHSLVYGLKVVHYTIKNSGGYGRFCVIDANVWPVSNPKTFITNNQLMLEPFILRPSCFELATGESVTFELLFCPITLGVVERDFTILCDNCHMQSFSIKGEGEMASIVLESIEDGLSPVEIGESTDISAQMSIKFDALNPFTYCQRVMILKNESHTEVPFCWKIIKPNLKISCLSDEDPSENVVQKRTLDFDSAFLIEPSFGVFQANDSVAFTITFAPLEVKENHSVMHLVLQGIPDIKTEQSPGVPIPSDSWQRQKTLNAISDETYHDTQTISQIQNAQIKSICLNDVTSLEMEVKGSCIPLVVGLNPPALIVSGELLIDTPVRRQLQIKNESMCPVNVNWKNSVTSTYIFTVEPQFGIIEPGEIGVVDVCLVSSETGFVRDTLLCMVDNMDIPLELVVEAKFKGPEIEINKKNLDFGLVRVNEFVRRNLKVTNMSSIICKWRARIGGSEDVDLFDEIKVFPQSGMLAPLQSQDISVTLNIPQMKKVECGLEIALEKGSTRFLTVLACVQSPQVVLESCSLDVSGKLFVNVPTTFDVKLYNQSNLVSRFKWLPLIGRLSDNVSIIMDPPEGDIDPIGEKTIKVVVTCSVQTFIDDIIVPCSVEDMESPVLLQVTGMVHGPRLVCQLFETSEVTNFEIENKSLELRFGDNVQLFQDVKRYILIENTTSIVTNYNLTIDYFKSFSEEVEVSKDRTKIKPNLADRQSKPDKLAHYDFCKRMLSHKNGLAVGFNPARGTLGSYDQIMIEVTAYNDMWGAYNDFIRIYGEAQTIHTEPIVVPMHVTVKGVPIEFSMTSGRKEQKPILRLGSKPLGHQALTRKVRLNNKSPCDLYIDWEMYSQINESDDKILDLVLTCGDPFPTMKSNNESDSARYLDSNRLTDVNDSLATNSSRLITDRLTVRFSDYNRDEDVATNMSEPLISVVLRPHEGEWTARPISFDPPQLALPSESYGFVTISFDPQCLDKEDNLPWDHDNGINYDNFLLGFVSLDEKNLRRGDFMMRKHQYAVEQVKLGITGRILRPSFQVEYADIDDMEEVQFEIPFSSLLTAGNAYSLSKSRSFSSFVTLRNIKDTEIAFSLTTRFPFEITNSKSYEKAVLGIGEVAKIEIKFTLDKRQLALLNDNSLLEKGESDCLKLVKRPLLEESEDFVKNLVFRDVVSINFDNTLIDQLIPLRATISFPELILSRSALDFQTSFIGETSYEHFRIINKSDSASVVFLRLENNKDSAFQIKENEYFIPNKNSDSESNHRTVTVSFSPKQSVEYSALLVIRGMLGEQDHVVPVRGHGSYDSQYQKKY